MDAITSNQSANLIYVLDDENDILTMIEDIIILSGIGKAFCFNNSVSFYKAIDKQLPDIILLDINMPGANGIDICINLKSQPKTKNIPVIFNSCNSDSETIAECFKAGAADYISKSYISAKMPEKVSAHLKLKRKNI